MQKAVDHMRKAGLKPKRIAAEFGFLPYDASQVLRAAFPDAEWVDALFVLERQRVKKSARRIEIAEIRVGSRDRVHAGGDRGAKPGVTKAEVVEALRRAETNRGLTFEYCLITAGTSFNRAPSDQAWEQGGIMSIDSGGNYHGYIGDVCRMAIQGEPDTELDDLLGEIETIQRAAMKPIRSGIIGREIYAAAAPLVQRSRHNNHMEFLAHGMGMVSHEAPRLTDRGPVPYPSEYAKRAAGSGDGGLGRDDAVAPEPRIHQAGRHCRRHRKGPRGVRRRRARLEQGGAGIVWLIRSFRDRAVNFERCNFGEGPAPVHRCGPGVRQ